jgi:hypothetical protein
MNFRIVPNWKKAVSAVILSALALNGVYALVKIEIPNGLAAFAKSYATSHNLMDKVVVEVPTIKHEDVSSQVQSGINQAVKDSFK